MIHQKLHRQWKRMASVPGLARNSAGLVGVIVIGIITAVMIFGNVKVTPPWEDRLEFSAEFESAPGVIPEQNPKVRIAGVDVGKVVDSEVTEEGTARLTFSIEAGHELHEDARILLRPKSVLNEMYIEISPGSADAPALENGDVVAAAQTERPIQADEVLKHLDERTQVALGNLLSVSDVALANADTDLPAGARGLNDTLNTFKPVVESLQQRRAYLAELVTAASSIARATGENRERTASLAASLQETLRVLSARDTEVADVLSQLPGTTDELGSSMKSVKSMAKQLNPTLDNVKKSSKELPGVLSDLTSTVENIEDTARAARPVVANAKPLVADLGPLVGDARVSVANLVPLTEKLKPATTTLMPYLNDLSAFVYNTSGVFAPYDANGGFVRGHLAVPLPDAAVIPGSHGGEPDVTKQKEGNR